MLPAHDAYSDARREVVEEKMSFCPAHSLAAHRPLGSIMRARMHAYEVLGKGRREENGRPGRSEGSHPITAQVMLRAHFVLRQLSVRPGR